MDLDEIDRKIVNQLKRNSRVTWKSLGKEIHMTGQAIGVRVERLIEEKYIKRFTVEVAYRDTEFITVYMETQEYRAFENKLVLNPNVASVYRISGDGCYLLITHFLPDELNDFFKELLKFGRYKVNVSSLFPRPGILPVRCDRHSPLAVSSFGQSPIISPRSIMPWINSSFISSAKLVGLMKISASGSCFLEHDRTVVNGCFSYHWFIG